MHPIYPRFLVFIYIAYRKKSVGAYGSFNFSHEMYKTPIIAPITMAQRCTKGKYEHLQKFQWCVIPKGNYYTASDVPRGRHRCYPLFFEISRTVPYNTLVYIREQIYRCIYNAMSSERYAYLYNVYTPT